MFTMILDDGSEIITPIFFLTSYLDRMVAIYSHKSCQLVWTSGRTYNYQCLPHMNFIDALRYAVKSDDWNFED